MKSVSFEIVRFMIENELGIEFIKDLYRIKNYLNIVGLVDAWLVRHYCNFNE